jgi:hypothetical protein
MPLGDPHTGGCTAGAVDLPAERVRTCCNTGYARGVCPNFPGGDAPDVVRFGIMERTAGSAVIRFVVERDHHPFDHGTLALAETAAADASPADAPLIERQARAFLSSYLRRNA